MPRMALPLRPSRASAVASAAVRRVARKPTPETTRAVSMLRTAPFLLAGFVVGGCGPPRGEGAGGWLGPPRGEGRAADHACKGGAWSDTAVSACLPPSLPTGVWQLRVQSGGELASAATPLRVAP